MRREDLLVGIGQPAPVGKHRADVRQGAAVHLNGAGPEIAVQDLLHIVLQQTVGLQQIGQRTVFAAVALFRAVDRLVDAKLWAAGELSGQLQQPLEARLIAFAPDQRADHDGAHVHHGVDVAAVQRLLAGVDGVEGLAGGFHADAAANQLLPVVQKRLQQQNGLDDALDGKGLAAVAGPVFLAVGPDHIDAEPAGIGLGQLRDIVRRFAPGGIGPTFRQQSLQKFFHGSRPFLFKSSTAGGQCLLKP